MKRLCTLILLAASLFAAAAHGEEKKKDKLPVDRAVVEIVGPLVCTHCDLGIGDECNAGIQLKDAVFVLAGKANQQCLDDRLSGAVRRVVGTLEFQDGQLHVAGTADPQPPAQTKTPLRITGKVILSGDQVALLNGKQPIRLRGKVADAAREHVDQWVAVQGKVDFDRKGRLRLTAEVLRGVDKPPALPAAKSGRP